MPPKDLQLKENIIHLLKEKSDRPLSIKEIGRLLRFRKHEARALRRMLRSLIKSGQIYRTKSGYYGPVDSMNLISGHFEAHRDGYGFVVPDKGGGKDLFIPPRRTLGAMSGDHVVARLESPARREGSIIQILERAQQKIIGTLFQEKTIYYVKPKSRKVPFCVIISPKFRGGAKVGDIVVVEIISFPTAMRPPEGKVSRILSNVMTPGLEVDMIIEERSLSRKFPPPVQGEARTLRDKISGKNRVDCRDNLTVTVDGETAKDFDDAISIRKAGSGFVLLVHIADVGRYVAWDSPLDLEARRRGTSVYFPGSVIPMLPERLSNDLCSLVPRRDRPTFTAEIHFDSRGMIAAKKFYPSIINSNERMTYTSVRKILVDHDSTERHKYDYLLESFEAMEELANILKANRIKRGSLDFDLPEPEILLDIQGNPEAILKAERNIAHMIIEEFMISANEAVASYLETRGVPSLYRVHEKPDPDKIEELKPLFNALGMNIRASGTRAFQAVLKKTKGTPEEELLNIILLRSLKQAKYSTENIGHFGLASASYTHFTSPIRRYPDLIVHRVLRDALRGDKLSLQKIQRLEKALPDIASHSSQTERMADEAERDVVSAMKVWFMKDKAGEEYTGIVSSITSQGLKIQLREIFVEGFLHVSSMYDDYYRFDEKNYRLTGRRTKKSFSIGQKVAVRIDRVDTDERQIVFGLV